MSVEPIDGFAAMQPLDQSAIDALFSFGEPAATSAKRAGLDALVDVSAATTERLPLLEVIFERLVRSLSTAMRNFTADAAEATLEEFESMRFDDYSNSLPLPLILGVFRAEEWDNFGIIAVDSTLVYAVVDALMGGRRGVPPFKTDGRAFTTLELRFVERMMDVILRELTSVFEPISPVQFKLERTETSPRFAAIAPPTNIVAVARLRIDLDDRGGRFSIMLPYTTLEPIRALLVQRFMGEKLGRDHNWDTMLHNAIVGVPIDVRAQIAQKDMCLKDLLSLEVGQLLRFEQPADAPIALRADRTPLVTGQLLQAQNRYIVRVEH
jgi:flagellar motor switch protein FliM